MTTINEEILLNVEKPARYIGNEINVIHKEITPQMTRFALCFPDLYEIGMSNLGISILYGLINQRSMTYCERVFSPAKDLEHLMRFKNIPLFTLETKTPLSQFDFLGFTFQYEMSYTNVLGVLDLAGIPMRSKDRTETDPIICAGGPCVFNPEPMAEFIDLFYIGEAEASLNELLDLYDQCKAKGINKEDFLLQATQIQGIYVPRFYDVTYDSEGLIQSFLPNNPTVPALIKKAIVTDLSNVYFPKQPLVPLIEVVHNRVVLELFRGCSRGCRFCQAGMIYRPVREKNVEVLKKQALELIEETGYEEISLVSLSSSDYSGINELTYHMIDGFENQNVNISLPSLRIDEFSLEVMSKIQDVRKSSLTFAPEAGSQRMRDVINKGITEEDILTGCQKAFAGGWNKVKLYFMLGLPTETMEDVTAIGQLAYKIVDTFYNLPRDQRQGRPDINVSTSFFIPKSFTPFQWMGQDTYALFMDKQNQLARNMHHKNIRYNCHDAKASMLECLLARGDRKVSEIILKAYEKGCSFDSWSEHFKFDKWMEAITESGLDYNFYTTRERFETEIFPWDHIDCGVTKSFLWREYQRSQKAEITKNCMVSCAKCGADCFGGGICFEN